MHVPLLLAAAASVLPGVAAAQARPLPDPADKQAVAVRITGPAPTVDGRLDDAAWTRAQFFSDFIQKEPVQGAEPAERTEVGILYDGNALYVAFRMYSDDPAGIQALLSRRDAGGQSQHVWISLDTYRDRRTAYSFGLTASGVRMDWFHPFDNEYHLDPSFDPVWEGKARIDSLGWTAEMRIPFSQLRFTDRETQVWGLNVDRRIPERNEDVFWIPVPRDETGWSSRMGTLVGIEGITPRRRIEVAPYVASEATVREDAVAANPFDETVHGSLRAGADLKMGLGPNLTLDATVNPDFGQVEADPAVVNLSAFEIFFAERRPFFTEGSELLSGGGASYFYSRRIGQAPRGPAEGDYVDQPGTSTILGAAKLTGRTGGGLSVGALAAVTDREDAQTFHATTNAFRRTRVAPVTGYGVMRLRQEFGPSQSTGGAILTGVRRNLAPDDPLASFYPRSALAGGTDWNLRIDDGAYTVGADVGFSYVEGDTAAILALQTSSARYYQRPDADYMTLDPSRTSLFGYRGSVSASKNNGDWRWDAFTSWESPGIELNDAGRLGTADDVGAFASVGYRDTDPGPVFRNWGVTLGSENLFTTDLTRKFGAIRTDATLTWKNFWQTDLTAWVDVRSQSTTLTRGGPSMQTPLSWVVIGRLGNSFASTTRWNGRIYYGRNELGGLTYRLSGGISIRPGPRWQLSIDPNYLRDIDPRQYVATVVGGPVATFGNRYVFAEVDRSTWLARIRLNFTVTPDLTLEFYAEPFSASGRFAGHGELTAAGTNELLTYGDAGTTIARDGETGPYTVTDAEGGTFTLPARDFNIRSFRSNFVVRWEWRPGSTLFLVWQQDRSRFDPDGDLVRPLSLLDALGAAGDNFLALKATYWFGL